MKALIVFSVILFSFGIFAQTPRNLDDAPKNLARAITSGNEGMASSALFHAVKIKLYHPQTDMVPVHAAINKLLQGKVSDTLRYQAFLAQSFLSNDQLITHIKKENYRDAAPFFVMLSDTLQRNLLVSQ